LSKTFEVNTLYKNMLKKTSPAPRKQKASGCWQKMRAGDEMDGSINAKTKGPPRAKNEP